MLLDTTLLNTQHYKAWIKGNVEQSKESISTLHLSVVAIEKGAFESPLSTVAKITLLKLVPLTTILQRWLWH